MTPYKQADYENLMKETEKLRIKVDDLNKLKDKRPFLAGIKSENKVFIAVALFAMLYIFIGGGIGWYYNNPAVAISVVIGGFVLAIGFGLIVGAARNWK